MAARPRSAPVPDRSLKPSRSIGIDEHVILLITHEGMMGADLSDLTGWHVRIDEMPLGVVTDNIGVEAGALYLQQTYDL